MTVGITITNKLKTITFQFRNKHIDSFQTNIILSNPLQENSYYKIFLKNTETKKIYKITKKNPDIQYSDENAFLSYIFKTKFNCDYMVKNYNCFLYPHLLSMLAQENLLDTDEQDFELFFYLWDEEINQSNTFSGIFEISGIFPIQLIRDYIKKNSNYFLLKRDLLSIQKNFLNQYKHC